MPARSSSPTRTCRNSMLGSTRETVAGTWRISARRTGRISTSVGSPPPPSSGPEITSGWERPIWSCDGEDAMRIHVGAKTEVGRVRERNEDAYLVREPLYAVADGMGGHRGGDVASSMTLEALEHVELGRDAPLDALVKAIRQVNGEVLRRGQSDRDLR